jgi:hypothetical protein
MPRVAAPKTPGEVTQAPAEDLLQSAPESVSVDRSLLESMQAQIAKLSSEVKTLRTSPGQSRPVDPVADLPNADGIDVAKLKTPVLTKQGWLVPESYGANPNAPKAF